MPYSQTMTLSQISSQVNDAAHVLKVLAVGLPWIAIAVIFCGVGGIFFSLSCYKTLKKVPKQFRVMPAWCAWLFAVPVVGYLAQWFLLPFAIPRSLKRYFSNNGEALSKVEMLFAVGLVLVFLELVMLIAFFPLFNYLLFPVCFILWVIYWVKICKIRKNILEKRG